MHEHPPGRVPQALRADQRLPLEDVSMTSRAAAALLFFLSAAVLMMEILAARLLAPVVGLSLETYTAIIGVVLAGIAVGHAVGGHLADRFRWYVVLGPCVTAGGFLAFAIPPLVAMLAAGVARPSLADVVIVAACAFFLPTAALSAASPVVTKARLHTLDTSGRVVGFLSASSTAGALTGTFLTGFVLVTSFPTPRILYGLAGALVVVGVILLPRRYALQRGIAAVAVVPGMLVLPEVVPSECQTETRYYCVQVRVARDDRTARVLQLDTLSHSYVDLDDPGRLGFRYQRAAATALASIRPGDAPVTALHIGGGGFAFPRHVAATRPGSRNRVLELDPDLDEVAARHLDLNPDVVDVVSGDARTALAHEPRGAYDVVIADAFGSLDPPWHLLTVETARLVRSRLAPGGAYLANVVDDGRLALLGAEIATLQDVFPHVSVVVPPAGREEHPANNIIVASEAPVELRLARRDGRVLRPQEVERLVEDAEVLTDDFAPVERLIGRHR